MSLGRTSLFVQRLRSWQAYAGLCAMAASRSRRRGAPGASRSGRPVESVGRSSRGHCARSPLSQPATNPAHGSRADVCGSVCAASGRLCSRNASKISLRKVNPMPLIRSWPAPRAPECNFQIYLAPIIRIMWPLLRNAIEPDAHTHTGSAWRSPSCDRFPSHSAASLGRARPPVAVC